MILVRFTAGVGVYISILLCVSFEVTVTSLLPPHLCRFAVFSVKPTFSLSKVLHKAASGVKWKVWICRSGVPRGDVARGAGLSWYTLLLASVASTL